jgi:hypothetical protein
VDASGWPGAALPVLAVANRAIILSAIDIRSGVINNLMETI